MVDSTSSRGGYSGLRDMFDGGGPGQSGSRFEGGGALSSLGNALGGPLGGGRASAEGGAGVRPRARPDVVTTGVGDARQYVDTRTGDRVDMPNYGAVSIQGFTSADPGNVMRNRLGAAQYAPGPVSNAGGGRDVDLTPAAPAAVTTTSVDSGNQLTGEEVSRRNARLSRVPSYAAGGYVGKDGVPERPSTASMDLPPALARMLELPMQSYAEGGMVGPGGVPQRPMASPVAMQVAQQGGAPVVGMAAPGQTGRPLNFAAIDQQVQQFMQQNPQQVEQIRAQVQQAMAAGEIDESSLNTFVQIATVALQNPEMWPQLRQVLIQQGMLDADEVSEQYDQGFLIVLYIIGKTMGGGAQTTPAQATQPPMSAGQAPQMSMAEGGALPAKSKNPDGSIPINAHEGEYVIPADVTRKLGTDHFDKLIAKARGADTKGEQ